MRPTQSFKNNLCALFVALAFVLLPVQPLLFSEEELASIDIGKLAIPESLGKIEERFQGTSKRWVISIQDVHAHFGAQENIAAILGHLNEIYGLRLVAYEGGWNITSYPKTWEIQSSRKKQLVLRTLLEEDIITGSAYAAMTSKTPIVLHGVEDPEIYKQNLRIYLEFIEHKDSVEKEIANFEQTLSSQKSALYNPDLLDFDRALLKFRADAKEAEQFLPRLLSLAKKLSIDLHHLPQIKLFMEVSSLEKSIDKNKLKSEIDRIMLEHKNSRLSFEEMLRHGTLTDEQISFYPNVQKQRELLKLSDQIIHDQLFTEIDHCILLVKAKLYKNAAEQELDQAFDRFTTAKKIMTFKATPADLKLYRKSKALMLNEMKAADLDRHFKLGRSFYRLAEKRNEIFYKQITDIPALRSEDIALVAGGFHTDGMRELLRKASVSYIVITPQLGQESPNEKLYFKQLRGLKVLAQTLSEIGNRLSDGQDSRIAEALRQYSSGLGRFTDIREVVAFVAKEASIKKKKIKKDFLSLSTEEQRLAVEKALQSVLSGKEPVSVIIRADALTKILAASPSAEVFLKAVIENSANHLTVLYKSFSDVPEIISDAFGSGNVRPVGETDILRAISHRPNSEKKNKLAVIADDYEDRDRLVLKEAPIALLLFRPLLEQGWQFTWSDAAAQSIIAQLAEEILSDKGFSASA